MDVRRMRPSAQTLDWVERVAVAWRRMTGGIGSVVHRLSISQADFDSGRWRFDLAVPRLVKPSIPGGICMR